MKIIDKVKSSDGGFKYLLYAGDDANTIEATFFHYGDERLPYLGISSQFGCAVGCVFCETGRQKLMGNMTAQQIVRQIELCSKDILEHIVPGVSRLNTVSFAGMGEPMHNLEAVKEAAIEMKMRGMTDRVTLTTSGVPQKFSKLREIPLDTLSISLHATTDELRRKLIPGAEKHRINDIIDCAIQLQERTGIRLIINYLLLEGINDGDEDLHRLSELVTPERFMIRLKYLNDVSPVDGLRLVASDRFETFSAKLRELGFDCEVDVSQCRDVYGACGQLRSRSRTLRPLPVKILSYWAAQEKSDSRPPS